MKLTRYRVPSNVELLLGIVTVRSDGLGAFQSWFGGQPDTRAATLIFGLFHGFGLATKIQEFELARDGLLANLVAFNVGVAEKVVDGLWQRTHSSALLLTGSLWAPITPPSQRQP